ncbi:Mediator of RNA polymerase II transcription subunit 7 [Balamuthia mandrillaris]
MEGPALVSSFPPPPPYYKLYTDERLRQGVDPPPPPAIQGTYTMFGASYTTEDVAPNLEDQGRPQLYPKGETINHTQELKKMNRSLLFNFLELVDLLTKNPPAFREKVEDVELLFVNMHHLLNSYRPHQARQSLITIMENQIQRRQDLLRRFERDFESVRHILQRAEAVIEAHTKGRDGEEEAGETTDAAEEEGGGGGRTQLRSSSASSGRKRGRLLYQSKEEDERSSVTKEEAEEEELLVDLERELDQIELC